MNVVIALDLDLEARFRGVGCFFENAAAMRHAVLVRTVDVDQHIIDQRAVGVDDIADVKVAWLGLGNIGRGER